MASTTTNTNNTNNNNNSNVQINGGNQKLFQSSTNSLSSNNSDIDGLPKSFINAMRTLFDIMADPRTGFVRFSDIEQRWQEGSSRGMPLGVIESLRKVTPDNGNLSFERFCNGLKICLIKNQTSENPSITSYKRQVIGESTSPIPQSPSKHGSSNFQKETRRPPSAPVLDYSTHLPKQQPPVQVNHHQVHPINTATVRPNTIKMSQSQRTLSMPQLSPDREPPEQNQPPVQQIHNIYTLGPPKPPRSMRLSAPAVPERVDKAEIRNALHNWQLNVIEGDKNKQNFRMSQGSPNNFQRSSGDGQTDQHIYQKKTTVRRREPRRHTLQNGIDYNMLKRMKQIEQEKDVLLEGLSAVEKARDWYLKQIAVVQEKIKTLGRTGTHMEHWTEAQQERVDLQRARIFEVNRHLMTLYESDGFPMHMNLALHHHRNFQQYGQGPSRAEIV
uniref:CSON009916 protein n=1 Tax=Culicoides sonorensis TaxID=179676 RepID=A0A336MYE5_CULSO